MAQSTAASPGTNAFSNSPHSHEHASLDFLSFMGLQSDSPLASFSNEPSGGGAGASAGPSRPHSSSRHHAQDSTEEGSGGHDGREELDANTASSSSNSVLPFGPSQVLGLGKVESSNHHDFRLDSVIVQGQPGFDAAQAQLLQQQLEHIHMQSPLSFQVDSTSPFHPVAQMMMNSPLIGMQLPSSVDHVNDGEGDVGGGHSNSRGSKNRGQPVQNGYGVITPAPSSDMFPQSRADHMSPIQLEMLARAEQEYNNSMTPLLSPAMSAHNSTYASPAKSAGFQQSSSNRSPLEQLQEQQRQFQEQLAHLQQQQKELQATAAAISANGHGGSPYNAQNLNVNRSGSIGAMSPGVPFSPLTSPALEGHWPGHHFQQQHQQQQSRHPHPLSALSSPALNPVGSQGGAQQTLSPALLAQPSREGDDPDYSQTFALEPAAHDGSQSYRSPQFGSEHHSPLVSASRGSTSTPGSAGSGAGGTGAGTGAGPHRHALPSKSRPSPMMKPVNHRSHGRHASTGGNFSVPTSPAIQRVVSQNIPGMGYLPPAAMQQQNGGAGGSQHSGSASTPSPVDLSQIMPPPPVPLQSNLSGMVPMTPASLMNLGGGIAMEEIEEERSVHQHQHQPPPPKPTGRRLAAVKKATGTASSSASSSSRLASNAAGKRALAMRPPSAVSRAGKNGTGPVLLEGETRKTSHKAAEQKRRDSLKIGFDELRLLLPPINTEALDPESGEPIPGSSAPRLLPKSSLVPDDNPNRGVSKVALLKFSNEYIVRLHDKVDKRDEYIERLKKEVYRLRSGGSEEVKGEGGEDLLEMDMLDGEEEDEDEDEDEEGEGEGEEEEMEEIDDEDWRGRKKGKNSGAVSKRTSAGKRSLRTR